MDSSPPVPPAMDPSPSRDSTVALPSTEMTPDPAAPKAVPKKRKAPGVNDDINSDNESIVTKKAKATPEAAKPRQRKSAGTVKVSRAIGRDYGECDDCDKKLIDMYDAGKKWPEIRKEWEKLTGEKTASSTLPNRYQRLMNNFTVIPDKDKAILIAAKQEVEIVFEREKWAKVAHEMQKKGTALYQGAVLERQHKKMMLDAENLPPVGTSAKKGAKAEAEPDGESMLGDDEE